MARILHAEVKSGERLLATDITDLTFFPKGTILTFSSEAWSATSPEFKNIWKVCNGQNGTPNLVDKFLRGGESSGVTGNGKKTLSINEIPNHAHKITLHSFGYSAGIAGGYTWPNSMLNTGEASINSAYVGGGQAFDVIPAFYTVIYIMKVA